MGSTATLRRPAVAPSITPVWGKIRNEAIELEIAEIDDETIQRYSAHWESITPKNDTERYQRWVYSLLSPNINWDKNSEAYTQVMSSVWTSPEQLANEVLAPTGIGLHVNKALWLWEFRALFESYAKCDIHHRIVCHPEYKGMEGPNRWVTWRDNLCKWNFTQDTPNLHGLGPKVCSFALEMCYPLEADVLTIDSHMQRWYGLTKTLTQKRYLEIEQHWRVCCAARGIPCGIARAIIWDRKHDAPNSSYWTYVFEEPLASMLGHDNI